MPSQDKSNSKSSTRKSIRFDNELLKLIDNKRGEKPFGTWVQELCAQEVSNNGATVRTPKNKPVRTPSNKKTNTPSNNSYATEHGLPSNITRELHEKIIALNKKGLSSRKIAEITEVSKSSIGRTLKITQKTINSE